MQAPGRKVRREGPNYHIADLEKFPEVHVTAGSKTKTMLQCNNAAQGELAHLVFTGDGTSVMDSDTSCQLVGGSRHGFLLKTTGISGGTV